MHQAKIVQIVSEDELQVKQRQCKKKHKQADLIVTGEYDEDNLWSHPTVQRIQRVFRLRNNFGFLKMLRIQELSGARWVPYELHFGMPLGDGALNRKICGKIEEFSLFEPESLALQSRHSRELCLRLLDFINTCNEMNVVLDGSTVIAPRKTLEFSGGKLRRRT